MIYKKKSITLEDLKQKSDTILRQVYEENRSNFIKFAKRYHLTDEDIIDVYQDAYIVFYDNIMEGKLQELTSSISTYLFSIGKYMIFDRLRKEKKTLHPEFDISLLKEKEALTIDITLEDSEITEEQQLLTTYFKKLGKQCQELLNLFYYRGFTISEIIAHTHYTSENVVKSTKSRCLKTLKERIKAHQ
jgi:RNA polymerase sigma-70 factor (ECF subfamily)